MVSAAPFVKTPSWSPAFASAARRASALLLDLLYPPVCLHCDAPTALPNALCSACFRLLRPITAPLCPVLGLPFTVSLGDDAVSAEALADPPPFRRARAALIYNDVAATIVSRLKYGDRPELSRFCARLMAAAGHQLWADNPVLVPVPLHRARQRERRYNQSAELAHELGRLTGLTVVPDLVQRTRRTRQQVGLSGDGRQRNVAGAFAVHPGLIERHGGRPVVVVDDVYTTGATTKAVSRALQKAGVKQIDVISFARVVVGDDDPILDYQSMLPQEF